MYHPPQQPHETTQLARLPLAKFSHTTTAVNHNGPLNWSHVFGNGDITGIIEKQAAFATAPATVLLTVFQDYEILEQVDLTYHAREAASQTLSSQNNQAKPIFAVIVKLPCLAVKYPRGANCEQVRRFQVKFSSDRDYYTTLAILSNINCPFSESNIGSTQPVRRPTSTQWRPGAAASTTGPLHSLSTGSGVASLPPLNPVVYPSHPSSLTTELSGTSSSCTLSSFLRPSSSSTITDLPPAPNSQIPTQPISQAQPDILEKRDTEGLSRPATACQDSQTLNQLLPPKRDLPFSKPAAKKPRTTKRQGDRTSTEVQPPAPDPKPTKTRTSKPTTTNKGSAKRSLTSLPQSNISTELPASSQPTTQANANTLTQPTLPAKQQGPLPTNTDAITLTLPNHIPQQQQQQTGPTSDLSSYIIAPTPERIMRLENWICEHIQDDDFLGLCQDMEGVWKRVAFGG